MGFLRMQMLRVVYKNSISFRCEDISVWACDIRQKGNYPKSQGTLCTCGKRETVVFVCARSRTLKGKYVHGNLKYLPFAIPAALHSIRLFFTHQNVTNSHKSYNNSIEWICDVSIFRAKRQWHNEAIHLKYSMPMLLLLQTFPNQKVSDPNVNIV